MFSCLIYSFTKFCFHFRKMYFPTDKKIQMWRKSIKALAYCVYFNNLLRFFTRIFQISCMKLAKTFVFNSKIHHMWLLRMRAFFHKTTRTFSLPVSKHCNNNIIQYRVHIHFPKFTHHVFLKSSINSSMC